MSSSNDRLALLQVMPFLKHVQKSIPDLEVSVEHSWIDSRRKFSLRNNSELLGTLYFDYDGLGLHSISYDGHIPNFDTDVRLKASVPMEDSHTILRILTVSNGNYSSMKPILHRDDLHEIPFYLFE